MPSLEDIFQARSMSSIRGRTWYVTDLVNRVSLDRRSGSVFSTQSMNWVNEPKVENSMFEYKASLPAAVNCLQLRMKLSSPVLALVRSTVSSSSYLLVKPEYRLSSSPPDLGLTIRERRRVFPGSMKLAMDAISSFGRDSMGASPGLS
jgi:hypothetical protein